MMMGHNGALLTPFGRGGVAPPMRRRSRTRVTSCRLEWAALRAAAGLLPKSRRPRSLAAAGPTQQTRWAPPCVSALPERRRRLSGWWGLLQAALSPWVPSPCHCEVSTPWRVANCVVHPYPAACASSGRYKSVSLRTTCRPPSHSSCLHARCDCRGSGRTGLRACHPRRRRPPPPLSLAAPVEE